MEIRIDSMNKDNSHSWVRISHGLNKLVTDLIDKEYDDNEQETPTTKTEVCAFASRSKAKAQPRRPSTTCTSSRTVLILERMWIDIEPGAQFDQAYPVVKKNEHSSSTRRITSRRRWCNRTLETERWSSEQIQSTLNIGLMMYGRARWQEAEATLKEFNTVVILSGQEILYLRTLQRHAGRNSIDPSLQDKTLIPNNFFEYFYHIGCAVNLHSITNSGLTAGGQNSSKDRQTVFFTAVNLMHKNHKDPKEWSDQTTSCISQTKLESAPRYAVLGRCTACSTERIEVLSNKIERNHPLRHTPSLLYPEGYHVMGTWRNHIRESVCVTSTTTENFLQR